MMNANNRQTLSLLKKLNLIFMGLVVPFLVVNVLITLSDIRELEQETEERVNTQMEYCMENFEESCVRITRMVTDLYMERDTQYIANSNITMDNYDTALAIRRIEDSKNRIESSDSYIKEVLVYMPSVSLVLHNTYIHNGNIQEVSASAIQEYAKDKSYGKIVESGGTLKLFYPYFMGDEVAMFTEVVLDNDKIQEALDHAVGYDILYTFKTMDESFVVTNISEEQSFKGYRKYTCSNESLGLKYEVYMNNDALGASYWSTWRMVGLIIILYIAVLFAFYFTSGKTVKEPMDALYNTVDQQELLLKKAELKQLQTQITPHFLYNTLFLLKTLIRGAEYDEAEQLAGDLGKYYRYITRNATDLVDLRDEDDHARIYADIQTTRFKGRIDVEYQRLPEELKEIKVPRLIIQPLLENAFGHGLESRLEGGLLRVTYKYAEDLSKVSIFVEDNGLSLTDDNLQKIREKLVLGKREDGEVTGIINIHKRLTMNYGQESGLYISRSELGGLSIEIRMNMTSKI